MRLLLIAATAALFATAASAATTAWNALPDWSGVWDMSGNKSVFDPDTATPGAAGEPGVREHPPYNATWEAKYLRNIDLVKQNLLTDPHTYCGVVTGVPRTYNVVAGSAWAVTPTVVWMMGENGDQRRIIYTDGRPHPKGAALKPTYSGDSIGHWEGDTLVIDTVGLMDNALVDRTGVILSGKAHVIQRVRRIDEDTLEAKIDIEDPVALTKSWHVVKHYRKAPKGVYIFDYVCAENNRNPVDEHGRTLVTGAPGNAIQK